MSGKIAVVTGAGSGIGRASALALLNDGYKVALAGRRKDALDETAKLAGNNTPNALAVPTDVTKPDDIVALFAKVKATWGRLDLRVQQCRRRRAAGAARGAALRDLAGRGGGQPDRPVPVHPGSHQDHEGRRSRAAGASSTTARSRRMRRGRSRSPTPRPSTPSPASPSRPRSTAAHYDIACGQIDIGNAVTPMTERMTKGVLQPNGTTMAEPRMDVSAVANAIVYMDSLPLDANVQFMTVMATKMPFVGRG